MIQEEIFLNNIKALTINFTVHSRKSIASRMLMTVLKLSKNFLKSGGDTKPSEYLKSKVLTVEEINRIKGAIPLSELQYALFSKIKAQVLLGYMVLK